MEANDSLRNTLFAPRTQFPGAFYRECGPNRRRLQFQHIQLQFRPRQV